MEAGLVATESSGHPNVGFGPELRGISSVMTRTCASLGLPQFRLLWLSGLSRDVAEASGLVIAGWLMFELTDSAVMLGVLGLAATIPTMLVGLMAGVITDWYDRRRILLTAHLGAALTMSAAGLLILSGRLEVWNLLVVAALMGSLRPLVFPARTALVPALIPSNQLTNAIALVDLGAGVARVGGAAGAGLVLALAGPGLGFSVTSAMFVAAWYFALRLQTPPPISPEHKSPRTAIRALVEAGQHAWRTPVVRWVVILALVFSAFAQQPLAKALPALAEDVWALTPRGLGILFVSSGVGGLVGALVLATLNPNRGRSMILVRLTIVTGISLIGLALIPLLPLTVVLLILLGAAASGFSITQASALLAATPAAMHGRIMGVLAPQWLVFGLLLSGPAAGLGELADTLGFVLGILIYGAVCVVVGTAVARFVPAVRNVG